eukprot:2006223-Alexandrium_andersonii.AAC.1
MCIRDSAMLWYVAPGTDPGEFAKGPVRIVPRQSEPPQSKPRQSKPKSSEAAHEELQRWYAPCAAHPFKPPQSKPPRSEP